MTEREKLIGLLREAINLHDGICRVIGRKRVEEVADYLLAHGVTIPVRCKNCWKSADGLCSYQLKNVPGKDFCGDGERKDK